MSATVSSHWEIRTHLGPRGSGWLWEVGRKDQVARVMIEISDAAWSADPAHLPEETRRALETDSRTELLKVLGHDQPPCVMHRDPTGVGSGTSGPDP
jgi:hypothetical protein